MLSFYLETRHRRPRSGAIYFYNGIHYFTLDFTAEQQHVPNSKKQAGLGPVVGIGGFALGCTINKKEQLRCSAVDGPNGNNLYN